MTKIKTIGLMNIPVENEIERNRRIALNSNLQSGFFALTQKYSTYSGNRTSLQTTIYHAIVKGDKHLNKIPVEKFSTDLILKEKSTKSTLETHMKKLEKVKKDYTDLVVIEGVQQV